jgi:hypothetical protein
MKDEQRRENYQRTDERRRFLGLLGGAGVLGLSFPFLPRRKRPAELSLKEADFYREQDLAG